MRVFTQEQIKGIFDDLAEELANDARNETQNDVSAALRAVSHRIACIDWEWLMRDPKDDAQ